MLFTPQIVAAPLNIHQAPIVLKAKDIVTVSGYPVRFYNIYKTDGEGRATPIPFQIDEIDGNGDFVLPSGKQPNADFGNKLFDRDDELSFMGSDVGALVKPKIWPGGVRPSLVYELKAKNSKDSKRLGAVYITVDFRDIQKRSKKKYVFFNPEKAEVLTSRYNYRFDKKNYLVVRSVDQVNAKDSKIRVRLIDSSTFYLKADLKYFLTFEANQADIESRLEAYKSGPIRTIVRVVFFYKFLQINFEMGMYTEVSLFSNSVELPALMHNPVDGPQVFNKGSGFYYGFAIVDNPELLSIETNMPSYKDSLKNQGLMGWFRSFGGGNGNSDGSKGPPERFWLSMHDDKKLMFFSVEPSEPMRKAKNLPYLYSEKKPAKELNNRPLNKANALGKSPVNLGLYFQLDKFAKGDHLIAFRLYFDNRFKQSTLSDYRTLKDWGYTVKRM